MKICFFTENYYKGGLDTFIINLINSWPDKGDNLTLICNDVHPGLKVIKSKINQKVKHKKYNFIYCSLIAKSHNSFFCNNLIVCRIFLKVLLQILKYPFFFPWYVLKLSFFFIRSDFDRLMLINGGYPGSLICCCASIAWFIAGKKPLAVMNFHSLAKKPFWATYFFEYFIDLLIIKSISHIISVSNFCLKSLTFRPAFLSYKKLFYIHNGIQDPLKLKKNMNLINTKKLESAQYCLMLATYHKYKGYDFIFKTFEIVLKDFPNVKLKIYGHGMPHEKKIILNKNKRLNLENNVILSDFTSNIADLYASATVLVVPSQNYESFGLTIIEAMSFGLPVVTTNVGGMPEVIGDSNAGYVCSKDNPVEFAFAIKKILRNPKLANKLGKNGRRAYEKRFSSSNMSKEYNQLLKNLELPIHDKYH